MLTNNIITIIRLILITHLLYFQVIFFNIYRFMITNFTKRFFFNFFITTRYITVININYKSLFSIFLYFAIDFLLLYVIFLHIYYSDHKTLKRARVIIPRTCLSRVWSTDCGWVRDGDVIANSSSRFRPSTWEWLAL